MFQLRAIVLLAACMQPLAARAADPLLMYVIGFASNLIESGMRDDNAGPGSVAAINAATASALATLPAPKAPASMDQEDLRELIDESFVYLNRTQRAELYAGLDKALADPANSAHREAMLHQFVEVARNVQFSYSRLDRLSSDEKRIIAERMSANSRTLPPDQQQALREQLRQRTLPMPTDLNDMVLAALGPGR